MKLQKRADALQQGEHVILADTHVAVVVVNWPQDGRPFRSLALRNIDTQAVAELSVPCSLVFDVIELDVNQG